MNRGKQRTTHTNTHIDIDHDPRRQMIPQQTLSHLLITKVFFPVYLVRVEQCLTSGSLFFIHTLSAFIDGSMDNTSGGKNPAKEKQNINTGSMKADLTS